MASRTTDPSAKIRTCLLEDYRDLVVAVVDAAAEIVASWSSDWTTEREAIVNPLRRELARHELPTALTAALMEAIEASGIALLARPVPAPPYLTVTTVGPVLRATTSAGRVVVTFRVFEVERGDPTRYRARLAEPEAVLEVVVR